MATIEQVDVSRINVNPVPAEEEWRVPMLKDLLRTREENLGLINTQEFDWMLNLVCCD